jgi:hypothetical protein
MRIDPRAARFGALLSTIVLALVLVAGSGWLLAAQAAVFGVGAVFGLRYAPYGLLFRWFVRLRLRPPADLEDAAPPRFSQAFGLVISLAGVAGYAAGVTALGAGMAAAALAAAFLNAAFGYCLGCQIYLMIRRIWPPRPRVLTADHDKEVPA